MISPWDIEPGHDLEEWLEASAALTELPSIRSRKKAQRDVFEKFRRGHKTYARLHYRKH